MEKEQKIIRMGGTEFWGEYIYLVTAGGNSMLKMIFDLADPPGVVEIGEVNTHTEHRNQGHATRLMQEAERIAKERGMRELMLWTKKGSWVQKWYERQGFVVADNIRPLSYETVWMNKKIHRKA